MQHEAYSIKLRKILNLSLGKKPFWFYILIPILFFISFTIYLVGYIKRKKSYSSIYKLENLNLKIICIGNILLGGSGKSPIVRKLAQEFLEKGFIVAIAARGITHIKKPVYNDIEALSDENKEHYELLKMKNLSKNLFILQNKKRNEALAYFIEILRTNRENLPAIFLLDDGLQHFACPRDYNLCVWQPNLLLTAPYFSLALGPYREGFGKKSFTELLQIFDFRLWSRTEKNSLSNFTDSIVKSLQRYRIEPSKNTDIIVSYQLNFFKILLKNDEYEYIKVSDNEFAKVNFASIIAAIAQPDNFALDIRKKFPSNCDWHYLFLTDHSSFINEYEKILNFLLTQQVCIFTFKDFFRWQQEKKFQDAIRNMAIYACELEIDFYDLEKNKILLSDLL